MRNISDDNNNPNADTNQHTDTRFVGIPNAPKPTCLRVHHHHHHHHLHPDHVAVGSPVNRVPSASSSSATPFSNTIFLSQYAPPPPSRNDHCSTKLWLDSDSSSLGHNKWLLDDLTNDFSGINISVFDGTQSRGYQYHNNNCSFDSNYSSFNQTGTLPYGHVTNNATLFGNKGYTFNTSLGSSLPHDHTNQTYQYHVADQRRKQQQGSGNYQLLCDRFMASQRGVDCEGSWRVKNPFSFSLNPNANVPPSHYFAAGGGKERGSSFKGEVPSGRVPAPYRCDNSIILQGKDVKQCIDNRYTSSVWKTTHLGEPEVQVVGENVSKNYSHANAHAPSGQIYENNGTLAGNYPQPMMLNFYSLAEVQGHMYKMAKDQNGCRFLQRMVDEGPYEDMCVVFQGIIANVVELMMDSFGNYLVQKLLDVCTEDQRLQIVLMLTKVPGQLVQISLNTHGTRVVQKLIETLNSPKQISLVKSSIQPGFLDLIKDLNGNHVIQRCLQCLSSQDNQFIFEAAVKFCVDIATHRHGCCVLQRCIDYSVGKQREKLVTEICKHGLLLAQDPFGNYVVQYIIEMETPAASTKLLGQFKGNFVNLSTQKFSSHVVEKCLKYIGDSRSRIVREFLSVPHFEQLLQDPYANYVIQSALTITKGSLHASLVEAVRPHKILRTSPYCKRIFSGNLLKK